MTELAGSLRHYTVKPVRKLVATVADLKASGPPDDEALAARARRFRVLLGIAAGVMAVLSLRLAYMQIGHHMRYSALVNRNRIDSFRTFAPRGAIIDKRMRVLAYDRPAASLIYARSGRAALPMARRLAPILGVRFEDLARKMQADGTGGVHVLIASHISPRAVAYVCEHQTDLPGVSVIPDSVRVYPEGDLACHILGYINSIPSDRAREYVEREGFPESTKVGWSGVELSYDRALRGQPGRISVEVNVSGAPVRAVANKPAAPGQTLALTIDANYQRFVQDLLAKQVRILRAKGRTDVAHAMAVALDPRTGAVLALASIPTYRPQWFVSGIPYDVYVHRFAPAERDWATQAPVAPGSTVKPVTALFALSQGAIHPRTAVYCDGGLKLPATDGTVIHCWTKHEFVSLPMALAESCDVYFYKASLAYGHWPPDARENAAHWLTVTRLQTLKRLENLQRAFGLGGGTGVDLPAEETGYVNEGSRQVTDLPYTAIGQNEVFTTLELATYAAAVANDGRRMVPHVVDAVGGKRVPIRPMKGVTAFQLGVQPSHIRAVQQGMYLACNDPRGTAYETFHGKHPAPYVAAGKTGTAETGRQGVDNAVFVGYAPFDRPRIAIAVVIPGGGHGADSTGPIVRAMLDRFFVQESRK